MGIDSRLTMLRRTGTRMKLWYCRRYRIECSLSTGTKAMITRICSLM